MLTNKTLAVCAVVLVFGGCKTKEQPSQAEQRTQPAAISQAQTQPDLVSQTQPQAAAPQQMAAASPSTEAPVAEAIPANASETQARALRRYNENAWFVQQALRAAQQSEALNSSILALLKAGRPDWDESNPSHQQIRGAAVPASLGPWIESAKSLEPAKRAAALLVADRIVVIEEDDGNLEPLESERLPVGTPSSVKRPKTVGQIQLESLGSKFSYDSGSERNLYASNWLKEAYELDKNGSAGELAFLLMMKSGFNTSPGCEGGEELFRQVLQRGAEYLKQKRSADVEARVHFMLGDAYRDIVVLAAGQHGDTYANPAKYKSEAPAAKIKAIAEYRTGLALEDKSYVASIANQRLKALQAGKVPHDTSFYCQTLD